MAIEFNDRGATPNQSSMEQEYLKKSLSTPEGQAHLASQPLEARNALLRRAGLLKLAAEEPVTPELGEASPQELRDNVKSKLQSADAQAIADRSSAVHRTTGMHSVDAENLTGRSGKPRFETVTTTPTDIDFEGQNQKSDFAGYIKTRSRLANPTLIPSEEDQKAIQNAATYDYSASGHGVVRPEIETINPAGFGSNEEKQWNDSENRRYLDEQGEYNLFKKNPAAWREKKLRESGAATSGKRPDEKELDAEGKETGKMIFYPRMDHPGSEPGHFVVVGNNGSETRADMLPASTGAITTDNRKYVFKNEAPVPVPPRKFQAGNKVNKSEEAFDLSANHGIY
jgi:hypothetical protein